MVYLLVQVLIVPGKMAPETRTFLEGGQLPKLDWLMAIFGAKLGAAPFNVSFLMALVAAYLRLAADLAHQARLRDAHAGRQPDARRAMPASLCAASSSSPCCSRARWPA